MTCRSFVSCRIRPLLGLALGALAAGLLAGGPALAEGGARKVDVELVLGVDVSWSMDHEEQLMQRDGYSRAFRSKEVIDAILGGGYGSIAVTYVEWAGYASQITVVPWTLIDSVASAEKFADDLKVQEPLQLRRTSISGAIDYARERFRANGYAGLRRVIDISGDGPNNDGRPVLDARNDAVAKGITINGLPLMTNASDSYDGFAIKDLDDYYSDCVIGGTQAFMIPVHSWEEFPVALRRKLVLELAGSPSWRAPARAVPIVRVAAKSRIDCQIGEEIWKQRRLMWSDH